MMARDIDAEKLTAFLCQKRCGDDRAFCGDTMVCGLVLAVKDFPTADVAEVRHGVWEVVDEAEPRRYGCSRCKCLSWTADNYCSYCGAKMDGERRTDEEPT